MFQQVTGACDASLAGPNELSYPLLAVSAQAVWLWPGCPSRVEQQLAQAFHSELSSTHRGQQGLLQLIVMLLSVGSRDLRTKA